MSDTTEMRHRGYRAVRSCAGRLELSETHAVFRVAGEGAPDCLSKVLPGRLRFLAPFNVAWTAYLDDDARVVALVHVVNREDHYLVVCSRPGHSALRSALAAQAASGEVTVEDISGCVTMLGIEGPFAWQILKQAIGDDVLGLRIHAGMDFELAGARGFCFRSGFTGEYGYRLLADTADAEGFRESSQALKDLVLVDADDVRLLAHESGLPAMGATVSPGDCPIELGLRWMCDLTNADYIYRDRLKERACTVARSAVSFKAPRLRDGAINRPESLIGTSVKLRGIERGRVTFAACSPHSDELVGRVILDRCCAFPGVTGFLANGVGIETVSSPMVPPLSARVSME